MSRYTYKFTWTDRGRERDSYIDAPSLVEAKKLFKEWFGIEADDSVKVVRLENS